MQKELTAGSAGFPDGFYQVERPPKRIHILGDPSVLTQPALAVVGARKATPYGLKAARHFARLAALHGLVIVSGGAIGCDQAAHQGALEGGGKTVVVLGCGADIIYPTQARDLFSQILTQGGAIISEAPWGTQPSRWAFRHRNRLIAGLAQATLITEAGVPSGTFSTADATLAQGKDVLAIPGSIFTQESKGANRLIVQGAYPVVDDQSFEDALISVFAGSLTSLSLQSSPPAVPDYKDPVLRALSQQATTPENLVGTYGESVIEVIRYLSSLELNGKVVRLRDGRYALNSNAPAIV
jgi:DNA processing protein